MMIDESLEKVEAILACLLFSFKKMKGKILQRLSLDEKERLDLKKELLVAYQV
jgi:hypothetical protein